MKKIIAMLLIFCLIGGLCACQSNRKELRAIVLEVHENTYYTVETEEGKRFKINMYLGDPVLVRGDVVQVYPPDEIRQYGKFIRIENQATIDWNEPNKVFS